MFVNFGYVGGESVYRGLSGNIGKRTQENASPSGFFPADTSAIFVNVPRFMCFIVFLSIPWGGGGRVSSFTHRLSSGMFGSTSGQIRPEMGGE